MGGWSTGLLLRRLGYDISQVHVRFLADKIILGQFSSVVFRFFPSLYYSIISLRSFVHQSLTLYKLSS